MVRVWSGVRWFSETSIRSLSCQDLGRSQSGMPLHSNFCLLCSVTPRCIALHLYGYVCCAVPHLDLLPCIYTAMCVGGPTAAAPTLTMLHGSNKACVELSCVAHFYAVGSGDAEGTDSGRASPEPEQVGTNRANLLGPSGVPSALTGQQLGEVLDSLCELSSVHMNLGLLQCSNVLAFADSLKQCPVSLPVSCTCLPTAATALTSKQSQ